MQIRVKEKVQCKKKISVIIIVWCECMCVHVKNCMYTGDLCFKLNLLNSGNQKSIYYGLTFADQRTDEFKCCLQSRTEIPSAQLSFVGVLWAH